MPKGDSRQWMTVFGAHTAALGFVAPNLPTDTPEWVRLLIGALLAGLTVVGGTTHSGIGEKRDINLGPGVKRVS